MRDNVRLILASASPRRLDLLGRAGVTVEVVPSNIVETWPRDLTNDEAVQLLAQKKASSVARTINDGIVIGADTIIELDGAVLGKPTDELDAVKALKSLRGSSHDAVTGVAVISATDGRTVASTVRSTVIMRPYSDAEIEEYVKTGEPLDKAGSYGIQGIGRRLVEGVDGCFTNVVGLPMCELLSILREFGVPLRSTNTCIWIDGSPCPRAGKGE